MTGGVSVRVWALPSGLRTTRSPHNCLELRPWMPNPGDRKDGMVVIEDLSLAKETPATPQ